MSIIKEILTDVAEIRDSESIDGSHINTIISDHIHLREDAHPKLRELLEYLTPINDETKPLIEEMLRTTAYNAIYSYRRAIEKGFIKGFIADEQTQQESLEEWQQSQLKTNPALKQSTKTS